MKVATATTTDGTEIVLEDEQNQVENDHLAEIIFHKTPTRGLVLALAPACLDLARWKVEGEEWQPKANLWNFLREACRG